MYVQRPNVFTIYCTAKHIAVHYLLKGRRRRRRLSLLGVAAAGSAATASPSSCSSSSVGISLRRMALAMLSTASRSSDGLSVLAAKSGTIVVCRQTDWCPSGERWNYCSLSLDQLCCVKLVLISVCQKETK